MDERVCFVPGLSSGLLWLFYPRRLVLVLIPTFRCADFSRELWRDCMVQHRWRCISADIARGCWSLGFFSSHLYVQCLRYGDCIVSELNGKSI